MAIGIYHWKCRTSNSSLTLNFRLYVILGIQHIKILHQILICTLLWGLKFDFDIAVCHCKLSTDTSKSNSMLSTFSYKCSGPYGWWIRGYVNFFCITSFPLASTWWVRSTFSSHHPLSSKQRCWLTSAALTIYPLKCFWNTGNRTWGSWVWKQIC